MWFVRCLPLFCLSASFWVVRILANNVVQLCCVFLGDVYCGEAGSSRRCEYTAVGYKVILAARLMQKAGVGNIYCDEKTQLAARQHVLFEDRPAIELKGTCAA